MEASERVSTSVLPSVVCRVVVGNDGVVVTALSLSSKDDVQSRQENVSTMTVSRSLTGNSEKASSTSTSVKVGLVIQERG